jgi:hypothetical protein
MAKLRLTGTYLEREFFHLRNEIQIAASRFISELPSTKKLARLRDKSAFIVTVPLKR